jgi:hypothetical protein
MVQVVEHQPSILGIAKKQKKKSNSDDGRDGGVNLTNVQCKALWN